MIKTYSTASDMRLAIPASHFFSLNNHRPAMAVLLLALLVPLFFGLTAEAQESVPATAVTGVNINTANAQTLADGLKGVGLARAQEIVRHRESYGPFAAVDELTEVNGIGPSTLEDNRALITLE